MREFAEKEIHLHQIVHVLKKKYFEMMMKPFLMCSISKKNAQDID
jgi:hypothetical protein